MAVMNSEWRESDIFSLLSSKYIVVLFVTCKSYKK